MIIKNYNSWAIKLPDLFGKERDTPMAGVYYFGGQPDPRHDGIRTAVFRTRQQARDAKAARFKKGEFRVEAVVIKVQVTITEVEDGPSRK